MSFAESQLTFDLTVLESSENTYYLNYTMFQGLLIEDGFDVKFYTTDNF